MDWVRARISGSLRYREFSREFGPGATLNLDQPVGETTDGLPIRVRDLLAGRLECFSPVDPVAPPLGPTVDVDDDEATDGLKE